MKKEVDSTTIKELEKEFGVKLVKSILGRHILIRLDEEDIPNVTQEIWMDIYNRLFKTK